MDLVSFFYLGLRIRYFCLFLWEGLRIRYFCLFLWEGEVETKSLLSLFLLGYQKYSNQVSLSLLFPHIHKHTGSTRLVIAKQIYVLTLQIKLTYKLAHPQLHFHV